MENSLLDSVSKTLDKWTTSAAETLGLIIIIVFLIFLIFFIQNIVLFVLLRKNFRAYPHSNVPGGWIHVYWLYPVFFVLLHMILYAHEPEIQPPPKHVAMPMPIPSRLRLMPFVSIILMTGWAIAMIVRKWRAAFVWIILGIIASSATLWREVSLAHHHDGRAASVAYACSAVAIQALFAHVNRLYLAPNTLDISNPKTSVSKTRIY